MQKEKEKEKEKEGRDKEMSKEEKLPPGFRFHPTDEELISCYLINKISDSSFSARAITDVDLNKCEPWELPGKAKMGEKEWYFFSMRDRKYPTGVRTNRATNTGYWKTTGKDKEILSSSSSSVTSSSELVGMKKTLVFYKGRAPRGEKSNWVMHEYRIHSKSSFTTPNNKDKWVVCRVFQKSGGAKKYPSSSSSNNHTRGGVVNPYSLEIGATLVGPPMMHQHVAPDPNSSHFQLYGRNFMNMNMNMSSADLAEFARVFRPPTPASTSPGINLPMQHLNYHAPPPPPGFTVSGLNLNLAGGGGGGMEATTQPLYRPMNHPHHHVGSNIMPAADNVVGYVTTAEMSNSNINIAPTNRYNNMAIDHCLDFDHYWPSY